MRTRITPREAAEIILDAVRPLPAERVAVSEALGRVLAQDVIAAVDLPPWDNSAMDGYACRRQDLVAAAEGESGRASKAGAAEAAALLRVAQEIPAGAFPTGPLAPGECARVFTGAPVPPNADTVIRQEDVAVLEDGRVAIQSLRDLGHNVRPRGEDLRRGERVFEPGTPVTPGRLGLLAALAVSEVEVHRRPRVAFLTAGDELADLAERDAILSGRKIASSNSYTLQALITTAGAEPVSLGIARDDRADLERRLTLESVDLLVTSAGMSVGERDYLRQILEGKGAAMKFWRVRMRPGAPVGFAMLGGVPWIGLPGNPVSTMVTFELFVRPAIRRLLGHARVFQRAVAVRTGERIELKAAGLQHFLRVRLAHDGGEVVARLTGPQGSGVLSSMAKADALVIVPEGTTAVPAGTPLAAIRLDETEFADAPPY